MINEMSLAYVILIGFFMLASQIVFALIMFRDHKLKEEMMDVIASARNPEGFIGIKQVRTVKSPVKDEKSEEYITQDGRKITEHEFEQEYQDIDEYMGKGRS